MYGTMKNNKEPGITMNWHEQWIFTETITYLVKKATFTDKLFSGFGIDGYCEPHVWHQELKNETNKERRKTLRLNSREPDVKFEVLVA